MQAAQPMHSYCSPSRMSMPVGHTCTQIPQSMQSPLDTERGYHVEYAVDPLPVRRPVCPVERGLYATPMAGRLRVAGLVEFGGTARSADPKRWDQLDRGARTLFGSLPEPTSRWMGFRPSLPDSLPVIDRVCDGKVLLAFGHQHLGLTQAAVTAEWVGELARVGQAPSVALYRLDRF